MARRVLRPAFRGAYHSPGRGHWRRSEGFIGRGGELARLEAALEQVIEGSAATVVIGGEAGIGKTRLIDEFAMRVAVGRRPC